MGLRLLCDEIRAAVGGVVFRRCFPPIIAERVWCGHRQRTERERGTKRRIGALIVASHMGYQGPTALSLVRLVAPGSAARVISSIKG